MHKDSLRFKKNGQSVVEIILAVAVFSIIASGVVVLGVGTLQGYLRTQDESRAIEIVQEGMDAVRSIRDRNWSSLSVGSHGLSDTGGLWVFSGVSEIVGKYTRTVTVISGPFRQTANLQDGQAQSLQRAEAAAGEILFKK